MVCSGTSTVVIQKAPYKLMIEYVAYPKEMLEQLGSIQLTRLLGGHYLSFTFIFPQIP